MKLLNDYKKHLNVLGISEETGRVGSVAMIHVAAQMAIIINLIAYVIFKWNRIDDRFVAIKALPVCLTTFGYTISLVSYFDNFSLMVASTLKRVHFEIPYKISHRRLQIIGTLRTYLEGINKLWRILLLSYIGLGIVFPVTIVLVNILFSTSKFQNTIKESNAVPLPWYFPESFRYFSNNESLLNTIWYISGYVVESVYLFISYYVCHLSYSVSLSSILNVQFEFKLLTLSILEMESFLKQGSHVNNVYSANLSMDRPLKCFLKYFVRHHQSNYRKFDAVNKGIRWIAFTVCSTATLYICLSMYTIVQTDDILKKINEIVFLVTWVNSLFQFCLFGERLKSEVENCRNALYRCAWFDKPIWFQRSLLIIMARTGRPVDIKPFGFYGFDFNRFATAMNAVYCYYNVLCNFKNKHQ